MSSPILFVAADRGECEPWVSHWEESIPVRLPVHWARAGKWKGRSVFAIANGAGATRAAAAVAAAPVPSAICSMGYCGALDRTLAIGDIFIADQVRDGAGTYAAHMPVHAPVARSGALISTDHIVQTAAAKRILRKSGCCVVEMEAGAVARASEQLNVPFFCIRTVSDLAEEDFANDFNYSLMPNGRFSMPRLIFGALKSPVERFRELIRLSRRTTLASKNLGDFLARCDF